MTDSRREDILRELRTLADTAIEMAEYAGGHLTVRANDGVVLERRRILPDARTVRKHRRCIECDLLPRIRTLAARL